MRPKLPDGYTVKYRHRRMTARGAMYSLGSYEHGLGEFLSVSPKGGETEAKVYDADDAFVAIGVATCHERDNFNRRIGRDIALGRALKRLAERQPMTEEMPITEGIDALLELPYRDVSLRPVFAHYMDEDGNPNRPALQLVNALTGEPWATVTVNLPDDPLDSGEFFVKDWGGNKPIVEALEDAGWLVPTGRAVVSGLVDAKVMRFGGELLAEYEMSC